MSISPCHTLFTSDMTCHESRTGRVEIEEAGTSPCVRAAVEFLDPPSGATSSFLRGLGRLRETSELKSSSA